MILGYVRVSRADLDVKNQRHEILEYANKNNLHVDEWIEIEISSRKTRQQRRVDEFLSRLQAGDSLIVSELSRIGRSTSEVINIVNELIENGVRLVAIKQNLNVMNSMDMTSKIVVTMFSLFAELERDIISQRTKTALANLKASGRKLGKPKGTIQSSKLDQHREKIVEMLNYGVPKKRIAALFNTSRPCLYDYIKKRGIK